MTDVYYIDYKEKNESKLYRRLHNKLFFEYEVINLDKNKKLISINRNRVSEKNKRKLNKYLQGNEENKYILLYSNVIYMGNKPAENTCFDGKVLMQSMLVNLIEQIEQEINTDFRNEDVHLCLRDDNKKDLILDIAKKFRCVNIVTNQMKKMKRLDYKLGEIEDLIYSISNNRRKALKKAKIIINFDFNNKLFEEYNINRNCIIINLNEEKLKLKNSFHGSIIEQVEIDYNNRFNNYIDINKFNKTILYESFIYNESYKEAKNCIKEDMCNIRKIIGINTEITKEELTNNYRKSTIKLDK